VDATEKPGQLRGRGATENPPNRFDRLAYIPDPEAADDQEIAPRTVLLKDASRSIITYNDSPDVGFDASINPYRGCEHGCIYCYARSYHEYLGFSAGLDFETKILVKEEAPELLRQELASPKWKPQVLAISGVTDAYQPVERRLGLTRKCLEVLVEFRNPVCVVTKNQLVTRDADLLGELARYDAATVCVSVTSLDPDLARVMEPRTSSPANRIATIEALSQAGVPVRVLVAPVIPGLNDHEVQGIIRAAAKAGAQNAGYVMLRLPYGVADLFEKWLDENFHDRKKKIMNKILDVRAGKKNDSDFGTRMRGVGVFADQVKKMFEIACRRHGLEAGGLKLSTSAFRRYDKSQLSLFDA
jgi:DNA repair photolyase